MTDLSKLSHEKLIKRFVEKVEYGNFTDGSYYGEEILARMASCEPDWQPIETAPKVTIQNGGDEMLGWESGFDAFHVIHWFDFVGGDGEWVNDSGDFKLALTHWAPRPKGPA